MLTTKSYKENKLNNNKCKARTSKLVTAIEKETSTCTFGDIFLSYVLVWGYISTFTFGQGLLLDALCDTRK